MTRTTILIFVAGAKELKEQRLRLKSLANDITSEYLKKGKDVVVCMNSYENFGENQPDYNDFIENKADLVFFVLDGRIGEYTKDEFLVASRKKNKDGRPKLVVFLKHFQERTPEIDEIETLINATSNDFYISYANTEELLFKAKTKVREYVDHHIEEAEKELQAQKRRNKQYLGIATFLAALILALAGYKLFAPEEPVLLFAGGGSVYAYLKNNPQFDVGDLHNYHDGPSLAMDLPSEATYSLIGEELQKIHGWPGHNDALGKFTHYYPVALSAQEADESAFREFAGVPMKGKVLSVYLGKDSLFVFMNKGLLNNESGFITIKDGKDSIPTITVSKLRSIIEENIGKNNFTPYSTRPGSGTLNNYLKVFEENRMHIDITKDGVLCCKGKSQKVKWFNDYSLFSEINSNALIFAARYFKPSGNPQHPISGYLLVDNNEDNKPIERSFFLYFAAYEDTNPKSGADVWWVPSNMVRFLEKINKDFVTKFDENNYVTIPDNYKEKRVINLIDLPSQNKR